MSRGSLPLQPPAGGQDPEVVVALDQVVGDHHDRLAQGAVGAPDQRPVAAIDLRRSGTARGTARPGR